MEQINLIYKRYGIMLMVAAILIGLLIFVLVKGYEISKSTFKIYKEYDAQTLVLKNLQLELDNIKKEAELKEKQEGNLPKAIFKPITLGLDTEAAISDEFAEILQIMRENKVKTRSVQYDADPSTDKFVQNAKDKYHVCKITAELVASYLEFENFLKDLYKHEHFLAIESIEINPYEKNKKVLVINFVMKLYAQKTDQGMSGQMPTVPTASEAVQPNQVPNIQKN